MALAEHRVVEPEGKTVYVGFSELTACASIWGLLLTVQGRQACCRRHDGAFSVLEG